MSTVPPPIIDVSLLVPELQLAIKRSAEHAKALGLGRRTLETFRSRERHLALYAQGRTAPGAIVTWTKDSPHCHNRAFDQVLVLGGEWHGDEMVGGTPLMGRTEAEVALYRAFYESLTRFGSLPVGVFSLGLKLGRDFFHVQCSDPFSADQLAR
jgi:hypothetical protein